MSKKTIEKHLSRATTHDHFCNSPRCKILQPFETCHWCGNPTVRVDIYTQQIPVPFLINRTYYAYVITNKFHATTAKILVPRLVAINGGLISKNSARDANRKLCGITDCVCGGLIGRFTITENPQLMIHEEMNNRIYVRDKSCLAFSITPFREDMVDNARKTMIQPFA